MGNSDVVPALSLVVKALGQPGGGKGWGEVYLEEKVVQVFQPLHPDWMHTETVCNPHFPQQTAGVKPWELFPPAFSSPTPFFRFLQIPASATSSE